MTVVTINLDDDDGGGGIKAHVVVDRVGSADCWGTTPADALQRATAWAAEHLGEPTAPADDGPSA